MDYGTIWSFSVQDFAGTLESVRGLVSNPNASPPRRAEKRSAEQTGEGHGARQAPEAEHHEEPSALGTAFAALKRTRLFPFRKVRKKRAGSTGQVETASLIVLEDDDYAEKERDHQRALSWLGQEQEETSFEQARRGALFLQHLERQGEPPSRLARELNSQLGVARDRELKNLLADQVRPQMDALAERVEQLPPEERRALAALVSRDVGTYTAQALTGPVLARSLKGDGSARVLLRSAIRANAALFGFNSDGGRLAADVLEAVRDRVDTMAVTKLTGNASTSAAWAKKEIQKKEEVQPAAPPAVPEPARAEPMQVADGFDEPQAQPAVDLGSTTSATPLNAQGQVPQQSPTAATGDSPAPAVAAATGGAAGGTSIPPATGLDPQFQIRAPESPEQAAEWLSDPNNPRYEDGIDGTKIRSQDTAWLASQDPEKLPEVFEALGPEETAQLVSDTVTGTARDNQQFFPNDAAMQSSFESIGTALGTMPEDFQTEVGTRLASEENAQAASLLLRQGGPGLDATRRGFLDAAREQVTNDPFMARAAGNVMAGSQALVNEYAQEWGDDFISMLDKGLGELPPYSHGDYHHGFDSMRNDGLEQVVGMIANYDGPDAQTPTAPWSSRSTRW